MGIWYHLVKLNNYLHNMTKPSKDSEIMVKRDENGRLMPGSILNPIGKPPGAKHLSTRLYEALLKTVDDDPNQRTYLDLLTRRILKDAIEKGNTNLINLIYDRVEGKPDQGVRLEVTNDQERNEENVMEIARRVSEELKKKKTE
jgi:hypothetical protein